MEEWIKRYAHFDKSTLPTNEAGIPHGRWIVYYINGTFWYECGFINGEERGYEKWSDEQTFYHAL